MTDVRRYILTGAPGAGKTAVVARMRGEGPSGDVDVLRLVAEPAREILAEQRAGGGRGTPDQDPELFVRLLLERSIEKYQAAVGSTLYDRGIPDCIGYAVHLGVDPTAAIRATEQHRYHSEVLVLPPWEEIYSTDDERKMTFDQSLAFHEELLDGYRQAGYSLLEVPRDSIDRRVAFIRDFLTRRQAAERKG